MKKYIIVGGDGKEYGPVSIQEVKEWVSSGRANGDTRIKEEGAEEWSRLRDMEFFGEGAKPAGPPTIPSHASTPSAHNPKVTPPPTADQLIGELQGRPHTFSIGTCISKGWQLTIGNFWRAALVVICMGLTSTLAALVPFGQFIAGGPLTGGLYYIFLKYLRGEPTTISDLFEGFNRAFLPLFLVYLIISLIMLASLIPMGIAIVGGIIGGVAEAATTGSVPILTIILMSLGILFSVLLMTTLGGMLNFSFPLTMDRGMDAGEAILATWRVTKNCWGSCLGLMIVMSLFSFAFFIPLIGVSLAGILGGVLESSATGNPPILTIILMILGVLLTALLGMFFSAIYFVSMITVAYEQLFGRGVRQ